MKNLCFAVTLFLIVLLNLKNYAQISHGGTPPTFHQNMENTHFKHINLETPDFDKLLDEDEFTDKHGIALRFAVSIEAEIDFAKAGTWLTLDDGSSICRLAISVHEAQALIMYYNTFILPKGGKLYIYNTDKTQVIGAFTHQTNTKRGAYATEMITGETTIFEYHAPIGISERPQIKIEEVGFVYRTVANERAFGDAGSCEVNIKCPEGDAWQDQARGITRIIVKQGGFSVWCTGSLVNNTNFDGKPYLLTADHCGPNATPTQYNQWIFYFRYEGDECANPTTDTTFNNYTIIGCSKIAAAGGAGFESDFKLVLLNDVIPENYQPYFNGWSTIDETSETGVTIHHPQGDVKKISTYTASLISTNWGNVPNTHWRVIWAATETEWGVTEGGSSGSPIFNADGLIIGQLTGGDASCINQSGPDYYGKFSHSWHLTGSADSTKLKPWLDPDDSGVTQLGGFTSALPKKKTELVSSIFPNPATAKAFVDLGENRQAETFVYITDLMGRVILSKKVANDNSRFVELDLSGFSGGIYFVQIETNGVRQTLKLIRQP